MRTLILPETIRVINGYAFDYTKTLENLYLGAHAQKTAANAFNFSGLTSFVVNAEEIETGAFTFCEKLMTGLYFTKKYKIIGETFVIECPSRRELCDNCCLTNDQLLVTAAPQLTVYIQTNAGNDTCHAESFRITFACSYRPRDLIFFLKAAIVTFRLHGQKNQQKTT